MSQTNEMLTLFGFSIPSAIMPAFALLTENQSIGDCVATQRSFVDGYTQITASMPVSGLQYATLKVSGIFLSSAAPSAATMVAIKFDLPPLWPSRLLFNIPGFDLRQPAAAVSQGGASEGATFNLSGVDFSLENAALILCTIGYTDPVTQVTVQPGFHLVGSWIPSDTIGLLNNLLNVNVRNPLPVGFRIYLPDSLNQNVPIPPPSQQGFTWEEAPLAPGVHLNANLYPLTKGQLPVNILSTGINLDNVRLRLYAPPTAQWAGHNPLYWPIMAATADLTISLQKNKASIAATVTALNITSADNLNLFVKFHSGTSIQSPNDLFPWVGVHLSLPPCIMSTNLTFTLDEAEIQLASDSGSGDLSIGSVGFSASFDAGTTISFLDGLLSLPAALKVYFTVSDPSNASNSGSIYVSLGAQVNFKGIPFDIIVDWQQDGDLYSAYGELTPNAKIPLATIIRSYLPAAASCHIPDLTFENIRLRIGSDGSFGISAIVEGETGWTMPWQSSGESSGATQKNTAYMWATIENSANGQTTGNLGGSLYLIDGTQIYVDYAFDGQNILQMTLYHIKLSELLQTQLSVPVYAFGNSAIDYSFAVNEATLLFNLEANAYTVSAATGASIAISLPGGGRPITVDTFFSLSYDGIKNYSYYLYSHLTIAGMDFQVTFSKGSTTDFTGGWYSAEGISIHLGDLAKFFEISTCDISNFNELASFTVVAAGIGYDATSGKFSMSIRTADGNEAFLCVGKDDNQNWAFIFGLSTSQAFKLSEIPGVGPRFAAAKEITFQQLALAVCSGCFSSYSIPLSTELPSVPNCDVTPNVSFPPTTPISPVASGTALFLPGPSIGAAGIVDISSSGSKCLANAGTLLPDTTQVAFQAQYGGIDQVSLSASLASDAQIPDGVGGALELTSITLSLNWASSALALQLAGDINFQWQHSTTIRRKITLNIDEKEADVTLSIGTLSLPDALTSIVSTNIQLSNVVLELGVFFEPPGFNFGFKGNIALGGNVQPDQFAIVLDMIGDAPAPVYLSFYCAKLSLREVFGLCVSASKELPSLTDKIQVSDLSFYWCEKNGIILPDGTVPQFGLAFSGKMDIFGYHFYGALNLVPENYNGLFQADPISVSIGGTEVFSLSASSRQTVSPAAALVKYNATTSDAVMNNEVVFKPNGSPPSPPSPLSLTGPFISFQTNRDFSATALFDISLMDIATTALSVVLRDDGTSLTFAMNDSIDNFSSINANIKITKWNNLSARVTGNCEINSIATPLGTITIETPDIAVNAGMNVSFDDFSGSIGTSLSLPSPLPSLSINLSLNTPFTFSDVKQLIINEAVTQIERLLNDARQWLTYINNGIVQFSGDVINVLNTTFQKSPWEIISLFSDGAFPNVIAGGPIAIARAICGEFYDNGSTSALQKLMSSFSAVSNIPGGIFSPSVFISALNVAGWTPKTIPGIGVLGSVTENVPFGWSVSAIIEARMPLSEEQLIPGLQAIIGSDSVTIANDLLQGGCNPINVTRAVYNAFPTSQTLTNLTSVLNDFYTGSPQQILQQIGQTFMDANIPLTVAENAASNVSGDPVSTIKSIWSNLKGIGSSIWSGISGTVSKIWHAITSWWPP